MGHYPQISLYFNIINLLIILYLLIYNYLKFPFLVIAVIKFLNYVILIIYFRVCI